AGGTKGSDVRRKFMSPPFGWPQDAVDGGLLTLVSVNALSAWQNGAETSVKDISTGKISTTTFRREVSPPSAVQRIKVREFLQECGLNVPGGEEALGLATVLDELTALAGRAGGEPPLPEPPSARDLKQLRNQQGNTR